MRKNGRKRKSIQAVSVLLGTAVLSAGCAGQAEKEDTGKEEVSIPIILTVDSSTGIKNEEDVMEAFNEKYDGK